MGHILYGPSYLHVIQSNLTEVSRLFTLSQWEVAPGSSSFVLHFRHTIKLLWWSFKELLGLLGRLFSHFSCISAKKTTGPEPKNISGTQISKNARFKFKKNFHSSDWNIAKTILKISLLFKRVGPWNSAVKFTFPYPKSCSKVFPSPNSWPRLSDMCVFEFASDTNADKSITSRFGSSSVK